MTTSHHHLEACGKITQEQLESRGQELNQLASDGSAAIDEQALAGVQGGGGGSIVGESARIGSALSSRTGSALSSRTGSALSNASVAPPRSSVAASHGSSTVPDVELANESHLGRHQKFYQYNAAGATLGAVSGIISGQR